MSRWFCRCSAAQAVLGTAEDHCVLQEHAPRHQAAEQREHGGRSAPNRTALVKNQNTGVWFPVTEQAHALMHEDQEAERCGPGHEHDAEAQQGAEHFFAIDADGLEDDDAEYREEAEECAEGAAGGSSMNASRSSPAGST